MKMDLAEVKCQLRGMLPDVNWPMVDDLDRAINWELWHGTLPDDYWTYVEPLERYAWRGFKQACEDLREALDSLPGTVYVDDNDWVYMSDPSNNSEYWSTEGLDGEEVEPYWIGPESWTGVNPRKILLHKETYSQVF